MSISINSGVRDTAISGVSPITLSVPTLNFSEDYKLKSQGPNEVVLQNITTPLDQPETIRFGFSPIKDIYKNSDVNQDIIVNSRKGVQVLAQLNTVYNVTDSTDAKFVKQLPVSAHLVIKAPQASEITDSLILAVIARLVGTLHENGKNNLRSLLAGVLAPRNV